MLVLLPVFPFLAGCSALLSAHREVVKVGLCWQGSHLLLLLLPPCTWLQIIGSQMLVCKESPGELIKNVDFRNFSSLELGRAWDYALESGSLVDHCSTVALGALLGTCSHLSVGHSRLTVWGLKAFLGWQMFAIGKNYVGSIRVGNYKNQSCLPHNVLAVSIIKYSIDKNFTTLEND